MVLDGIGSIGVAGMDLSVTIDNQPAVVLKQQGSIENVGHRDVNTGCARLTCDMALHVLLPHTEIAKRCRDFATCVLTNQNSVVVARLVHNLDQMRA